MAIGQVVWVGNRSGIFSVGSAYDLAKELSQQDVGGSSNTKSMKSLWKQIWRIQGPRVVKMFLWQACNNILPTKENLFKRKITDDPLCPICWKKVETVGHVLWSCSNARDVWLECSTKIQKCTSDEDAFLNILEKLLGRLEEMEIEKVVCIARQIWLRRNKLVFGDEFIPQKKIIKIAVEQMKAHTQAEQGKNAETRPPKQ